jgi:hypothetical protein
MKYIIPLFLFITLFLISCGPSAEEKAAMEKCRMEELATERLIRDNLKSSFDSPFPKRNRNLINILGDTLQIQGRCGPISFKIVSNRKYNLMVNIETGDTIFKGTVCKYRDFYYFNEKLNDTSYRIFALKVTDNLIYGLQSYFQYSQIDSIIEHGNYPKIVKFIDKSKKTIRLQPGKSELRKLYTSILANTEPFEIIRTNGNAPSKDKEDIVAPIESNDFEVLSNVYPNPAVNILNVELHQSNVSATFYLSDLNGKVLLQGQLTATSNKIDISNLSSGIYALTVISAEREPETVKIIKSQ